jgi:carbamoyl-phosphate synthase large subunit
MAAGLMLPDSGNLLFSIADKNKREALPIIKGFHSLGYKIFATEGTASMIEENHMPVSVVRKKLGQGSPNIIDIINRGSVIGIVNTITGGRTALQDGFHIRRAAVEGRIPCFTSLDTARAVLKALTHSKEIFNVKPIKKYLN